MIQILSVINKEEILRTLQSRMLAVYIKNDSNEEIIQYLREELIDGKYYDLLCYLHNSREEAYAAICENANFYDHLLVLEKLMKMSTDKAYLYFVANIEVRDNVGHASALAKIVEYDVSLLRAFGRRLLNILYQIPTE